jgi:hypothetical protein
VHETRIGHRISMKLALAIGFEKGPKRKETS